MDAYVTEPTKNDDGSPLTDLYNTVVYITKVNADNNPVRVLTFESDDGSGGDTHPIDLEGLAPGTLKLQALSYDHSGATLAVASLEIDVTDPKPDLPELKPDE